MHKRPERINELMGMTAMGEPDASNSNIGLVSVMSLIRRTCPDAWLLMVQLFSTKLTTAQTRDELLAKLREVCPNAPFLADVERLFSRMQLDQEPEAYRRTLQASTTQTKTPSMVSSHPAVKQHTRGTRRVSVEGSGAVKSNTDDLKRAKKVASAVVDLKIGDVYFAEYPTGDIIVYVVNKEFRNIQNQWKASDQIKRKLLPTMGTSMWEFINYSTRIPQGTFEFSKADKYYIRVNGE